MTLSAKITLNGVAYSYDMATGVDLDDLHGPGFVQKQIRVKGSAACPVHITFCPDTAGTRAEFWVQTGDIGNIAKNAAGQENAPAPADVPPYTIEFFRDGTSLSGPISVPTHWWHAGFVWETAPRARINSSADLIAAKLVPPYSTKNIPGQIDMAWPKPWLVDSYKYKGPMDVAAFYRAEGTTGEREELDDFSEWDARCLLFDTPADFDRVVAAAHAANSMPNKWFDEARGGLPSVLEWPNLNTYWGRANGLPNIPLGDSSDGKSVTMDSAHKPDMSYLHFLSTGSMWSLRNMHANINETYLETTYFHGQDPVKGQFAIFYPAQTRGVAWDFRDLGHAIIATRMAESWGPLPKGWYSSTDLVTLLRNAIWWLTEVYVKNPSPAGTFFHAMTQVGSIAPWQQWGYLITGLAECVYLGLEECRPLLVWNCKAPMEWVKLYSSFPCPYYLPIAVGVASSCDPAQVPASAYLPPDWEAVAKNFFENDIAAYDAKGQVGQITQAVYDALKKDHTYGGQLAQTNVEYPTMVWGSMRLAAACGVPGAKETADTIQPYLQGVSGGAGIAIARWCFSDNGAAAVDPVPLPIPNPTPAPVPTPEPIPNPQPPAGALHMSTPGSLAVGQTAHATLSFDDGHGAPSQPPVNIAFTSSPDGIVSVAPNDNGVSVTGVKSGEFTVTATADGGLSASISGSVALPLAGALHLAWD